MIRTAEHCTESQLKISTSHSAWTHFVMNSSVQVGEKSTQHVVGQLRTQCVHTSRSVREFDPSHNPAQDSDFHEVSHYCAGFQLLCYRARHHKIVAVSEHRHAKYRQSENVPVSYPIADMAFSLATSEHCAASFVQCMALSRTAHPLLHSPSSRGTWITIVRRAKLWICALVMS